MELADVSDSKSDGSDTVPVRPRSPAPKFPWACSSVGRALRSQRRGRGFDPLQVHQCKIFAFCNKQNAFLFSPNRYIYAIAQNSSYVPLEEFNLLSFQKRLTIFLLCMNIFFIERNSLVLIRREYRTARFSNSSLVSGIFCSFMERIILSVSTISSSTLFDS